jgi:small subunit ribosomal protein S21
MARLLEVERLGVLSKRIGTFMALRIKVRSGESVEQMLRRFKKMCEKEGLIKDVKKNAYYEKPSERRRRANRKSVKRMQKVQTERRAGVPSRPRRGPVT